MSLGGSEQTGMQTTTQLPPSYVLPQLAYGANEAQRMYSAGTGFGYYPENTVAGFSPEQQMAMTLQGNRALSGSPLTREGQSLGLNTLRGDFLGSNPYFKQAVLDPITDQVQGQFSRAGRLGSGANQNALTRALSAPLMQNYENERARQNQMIGVSQDLAQSDYADYANLAKVGAMRQDQAQKQIMSNMDRFNFLQSAPAQNLNQFLGQVGTAAGGYNSKTTPMARNPFNDTLGTIGNVIGIGTGIQGFFNNG